MKILLSGASGFIGKALHTFLIEEGHQVFLLSRKKESNSIYWDPLKKRINEKSLENFDVVILLNGANISAKRWTDSYKNKILSSRVQSTTFLTETLSKLQNPPKLFIQASAAGYYGNAVEKTDETGKKGDTFLAEVCEKWEEASNQLENTRKVYLRFAMVLGSSGGALKKIVPIFRLYLGAIMGKRKTMISWISLEDVLLAISHIIKDTSIAGPVNMASPNAVTAELFYNKIAKSLNRPCLVTIPSFMIKLIFGKMGQELFLTDSNIYPKKLLDTNYSFCHCHLKEALTHYLEDQHE